jgi:hypothetical protein
MLAHLAVKRANSVTVFAELGTSIERISNNDLCLPSVVLTFNALIPKKSVSVKKGSSKYVFAGSYGVRLKLEAHLFEFLSQSLLLADTRDELSKFKHSNI